VEEKKSRIQELREKIARNHPPLDPESVKFGAALVGVAEHEFKGRVNGAFKDRLHEEYKAAGSPSQIKPWLRKRLTEEFLSVETNQIGALTFHNGRCGATGLWFSFVSSPFPITKLSEKMLPQRQWFICLQFVNLWR